MSNDKNEFRILGKPLIYHDVLDSTNLEAKRLAQKNAVEGTIVRANRQTAGRGRLQRVWESPKDAGLWFSMILRPRLDPGYCAQITLISAVVMSEAVEKLTGVVPKIKWPNDLLVNGKKLCGILSEMNLDDTGVDYIIVGIGININLALQDLNPQIKDIATSLEIITGKKWEAQDLLDKFRESFEHWYGVWEEQGFAPVKEEWIKRSCTIGEKIHVKDDDEIIFTGDALSIDDYGSIVVQGESGEIRDFVYGEISIRNAQVLKRILKISQWVIESERMK